ncbi:hypothetical protein B0O99DRAFT_686278 [Bisporella sp. PMI_857]|nr:hypothetical protein B0O99DRAFT_686278 [Bisporella sp. PMI_857]
MRLFINYVPRWVIILTVLCLYLRLYFLIRDVHKETSSFGSDSGLPVYSAESSQVSKPPMEVSFAVDNTVQTRPAPGIESRSSPGLKRTSFQMMTYPLVYMFIFIIPTSMRIYQFSTGKNAPFAISTIDKACIVIQGFADAIIYGVQESTWKVWKTFLRQSIGNSGS